MLLRDRRTHGFEALDVQIDRASANGTAARHCDAGHAGASDERTKHKGTRAHGLDDLVFGDGVGEYGALDGRTVLCSAIAQLDLRSHALEQLALGLNVVDLRDVLKDDLILGEDGGCHAGKRGVLRAGDFDGAEQRVAATDNELVHLYSLRKGDEETGAEVGAGAKEAWLTGLFV